MQSISLPMTMKSLFVRYPLTFFSSSNFLFPETNSKKLAILHETLPGYDDETLEHYLEICNGNVDQVVNELLNET
jgi:hypothetical protein